MKEIKLDKNKSTIKQDISMCSNNEIVNTNFNNCSTRDTILNQKIENETERAINKETELEEKIKESGKIDDVLVNGESVVEDKIAKIDLTSYATKTDIEEEKTERQDEDTSIRARVKQEILDRKTADSALQTNIQNEATLRATADTNLGNKINTVTKNLNSEISTRASQDTNLQTQISTNKTNISNLTTRVSDNETNITALETDLSDETKVREEADTALETKLTTEATNRQSADNTLQENIDSLIVDGGELVYEQ